MSLGKSPLNAGHGLGFSWVGDKSDRSEATGVEEPAESRRVFELDPQGDPIAWEALNLYASRTPNARLRRSLRDWLDGIAAAPEETPLADLRAQITEILPRSSCLHFSLGRTCAEQGRPEFRESPYGEVPNHCPPCRVRSVLAACDRS